MRIARCTLHAVHCTLYTVMGAHCRRFNSNNEHDDDDDDGESSWSTRTSAPVESLRIGAVTSELLFNVCWRARRIFNFSPLTSAEGAANWRQASAVDLLAMQAGQSESSLVERLSGYLCRARPPCCRMGSPPNVLAPKPLPPETKPKPQSKKLQLQVTRNARPGWRRRRRRLIRAPPEQTIRCPRPLVCALGCPRVLKRTDSGGGERAECGREEAPTQLRSARAQTSKSHLALSFRADSRGLRAGSCEGRIGRREQRTANSESRAKLEPTE